MSSLGAFNASPLGAFIESPLGARGGVELTIPYLIRLEISDVVEVVSPLPGGTYDIRKTQHAFFHLGLDGVTETAHLWRVWNQWSNNYSGGFLEWTDGYDYGATSDPNKSATLTAFTFTTYGGPPAALTPYVGVWPFQDPDHSDRVIGVRHGVYHFASGDGAGPPSSDAFALYLADPSPSYTAAAGTPGPIVGGSDYNDGTYTYTWTEKYIVVT